MSNFKNQVTLRFNDFSYNQQWDADLLKWDIWPNLIIANEWIGEWTDLDEYVNKIRRKWISHDINTRVSNFKNQVIR